MIRSLERVRARGRTLLVAALVAAVAATSGLSPVEAASVVRTTTWTVHSGDSSDTYTMDLTEVPLLGPDFQVRIQNQAGGLDPVTLTPAKTYLGTVKGEPGAFASMTEFSNGTKRGVIVFDRGVSAAFDGTEIQDWVEERGWWTDPKAETPYQWPTIRTMDTDLVGNHHLAVEEAYDFPYAQYESYGRSAQALLDATMLSLNIERMVYLQSFGVTYTLGQLVIRGAKSRDPYATVETQDRHSGPYLEAVEQVWQRDFPDHPEDQVQVVSSDFNSGITYTNRFEKPQIFSAYYGGDPDDPRGWSGLARHEHAHSWGAGEQPGGGPESMTILDTAGGLARMSAAEVTEMIPGRVNAAKRLVDRGPWVASEIPPYAGLDVVEAAAGCSYSFRPLANDHSVNGSALRLTSFEKTSLHGRSVTRKGDVLTYRPPARQSDDMDVFKYGVTDAHGHTATGVVLVKSGSPYTVFEAEDRKVARPFGDIVAEAGPGTGSRTVRLRENAGLEWTVYSPTAREVTLAFDYATVLDVSASIRVNGVTVGSGQRMPDTYEREPFLVKARLKAGRNLVRFTRGQFTPGASTGFWLDDLRIRYQNAANPCEKLSSTPAKPKFRLSLTGRPSDRNHDGRLNAGDVMRWRLRVANTGRVRITSLSARSAILGRFRCPTRGVAVGKSVVCAPKRRDPITRVELKAGKVSLEVVVAAKAGSGSGSSRVTTKVRFKRKHPFS